MKQDKSKTISLVLLLIPFVMGMSVIVVGLLTEIEDKHSAAFRMFIIFCGLCPILFGCSLAYSLRSLGRRKSAGGYVLAGVSGLLLIVSILFWMMGITHGIRAVSQSSSVTSDTISCSMVQPMPEQLVAYNCNESEVFMDEVLRSDKNAVRTSSGLIYEIIAPGNGARPASEDDLMVMEWEMLNRDGSRVPTLEKPEGEVMHREFKLRDMMPGMAEGVRLIGKRGKIKLYIPPTLIYKENDDSAFHSPNEVIFIVELKEIINDNR